MHETIELEFRVTRLSVNGRVACTPRTQKESLSAASAGLLCIVAPTWWGTCSRTCARTQVNSEGVRVARSAVIVPPRGKDFSAPQLRISRTALLTP